MVNIEQAIINTLIYSDLFNYPLAKEELWKYLISDKLFSPQLFDTTLSSLSYSNKLSSKRGFYCLQGREDIIDLRMKRERVSGRKLIIAEKVAVILFHIPTIRLIAISGSLSMMNADKNDDIDFFIITRQNTLWTTRLFALLFLHILGKRRKRSDTSAPDKICINVLMDEEFLSLPKKQQNLYTAHEVVQIKSLFERNRAYEKFLFANNWINTFMPNSLHAKQLRYEDTRIHRENIQKKLLSIILILPEFLAKRIQLWYMGEFNKKVIGDNFLAFYPQSYAKSILDRFEEKILSGK